MATHDACLSRPDLANQDQPETARHPEGRSDEAAALLNTTPERVCARSHMPTSARPIGTKLLHFLPPLTRYALPYHPCIRSG